MKEGNLMMWIDKDSRREYSLSYVEAASVAAAGVYLPWQKNSVWACATPLEF